MPRKKNNESVELVEHLDNSLDDDLEEYHLEFVQSTPLRGSDYVLKDYEIQMFNYFHERPWRFAQLILNQDLETFQKLALYIMFNKPYVLIICSRGAGKTYLLGLYAATKSALVPKSQIGIIAPSFRQSKHVFEYIIKFYREAPLYKACFQKRPVMQQDICTSLLHNSSIIQAIPIGDGSKVRGSRFYDILIDEYAHNQKEILDVVVRGMGATSQDPIKNAKLTRYINKLKDEGKPYEHLLENLGANRLIGASTAYYKFNHLYDTTKEYIDIINSKSKEAEYEKYAVIKIPYDIIPDGFMAGSFIEMARRSMSSNEFNMEFKCESPSDSDGFFKASIVSKAFITKGTFGEDPDTQILYYNSKPRYSGVKGKHYILAVDPARTSDDCTFAVIEIDYWKGSHLLANLEFVNNRKFTEAADKIWNILTRFDIIAIYIDNGGGGNAIKDLLNEPDFIYQRVRRDAMPRPLIWDMNDPFSYIDGENQTVKNVADLHKPKPGLHILKMVNFNSTWTSNANHSLLSGLETNSILFPRKLDQDDLKNIPSHEADRLTEIEDSIERLRNQIQNIIVTKTPKGHPHWDTPKKRDKKDLYTALLIGYFELTQKLSGKNIDVETIPDQSVGGFVEQINESSWGQGSSFDDMNTRGSEEDDWLDYVAASNPKATNRTKKYIHLDNNNFSDSFDDLFN